MFESPGYPSIMIIAPQKKMQGIRVTGPGWRKGRERRCATNRASTIGREEELSPEVIHPNMVVITTGDEAAVAQTNTVDGSRVTLVSLLACGNARIPDLDHTVHATRGDSQSIGSERPDAFQVTEKRTKTSTSVGFPEADSGIDTAGYDVPRRFQAIFVLVK